MIGITTVNLIIADFFVILNVILTYTIVEKRGSIMSDIKEFVENIIQQLVDKPEEVLVKEQEGEHAVIIEVYIAKSDYGKVIGKKGKNADAIRTIVRAASAKQGKRCTIEINE